jgi:diadenosine tetraphosphate (Ap4A) HIT family hydrolase/GNAT superfamily N-acetyltransferase
VTPAHIPQWLDLAAQVEPVFQASMARDRGFHEYIRRKIAQREAFAALDRERERALVGVVAFSRAHRRISWLAVSEPHRNKGVGSRLLACALRQLDPSQEVSVTTFREGDAPGRSARHLLQKLGFVEVDATAHDAQGNPRCIMKRPPNPSAMQGHSFHYRYHRYVEWSQPEHCPVCRDEPGPADVVLICELEHAWVEASIHAQGRLWGKCHVLCKKHYVELYEMPEPDLLNFMADVQKAARALKTVSGAVKINYEIHGNTMPHLHVHLFPRYLDDPHPGAPIEYRVSEPSPYADEQDFERFVEAMRRELT